MIQKCKACDFITSVEVLYEVAEDGVVFQVDDRCCNFKDCKMLRAILGKALCVFLQENPTAVEQAGSAAYSDCCCKIPAYPNMTWYFGSGQAHWGVVVAAPDVGTTGVLTVPTPFFDVV